MFPLGTVLFPGTVLPLHVFEPRYRALTGYCLEHDGRLGIVLIERGSEVGGGDVRFSVGTQGRIAESVALPDGRWVVAVVGERRIRVEQWLTEDPFPQADIAFLDDRPGMGAGRELLVERVHRALALKAELGEWPPDAEAPELASDPAAVAWQVGALGLIGVADAQRVLETDGVDDRLDLVSRLVGEEIDVLALRAAGR